MMKGNGQRGRNKPKQGGTTVAAADGETDSPDSPGNEVDTGKEKGKEKVTAYADSLPAAEGSGSSSGLPLMGGATLKAVGATASTKLNILLAVDLFSPSPPLLPLQNQPSGGMVLLQANEASGPRPSALSWSQLVRQHRPGLKQGTMAAATGSTLESQATALFVEFIKTFKVVGGNSPLYMDQVEELAKGTCKVLNVRFDHLMDILCEQKKFVDLSLKIGNSSSYEWLAPSLHDLLGDDLGRMQGVVNRTVQVHFLNKPDSIVQMKSFLSDERNPPARWVNVANRCKVYASTSRGRIAYRAAIATLMSLFKKDLSFDDDSLKIEDIFIIDSQRCFFAKSLRHPFTSLAAATNEEKNLSVRKANTLSSLWDAMEEYYIDGLNLPLFFSVLKFDMKSRPEVVKQDWFPQYLELHFALTSSMCRKTFTQEIPYLDKLYLLNCHSQMGPFLAMKPRGKDWRCTVKNSEDSILNGVYWHGINLEKHGLGDFAEFIDNGNYCWVPIEAYTKVRENTIGGILLYKRNLIEHFADQLKKEAKAKGLVRAQTKDSDEVELFASNSVPFVEPYLLQYIMEKKLKMFDNLMDFYKSMYMNNRDLPSG